MASAKEWFSTWFDSPYYHILYHQRDRGEAEQFITNLNGLLKPKKGLKVLDLACGRGRHCISLNKLGLDVTGIDISETSIAAAQQENNEMLEFLVHDMRDPFRTNYFDIILNLFTSFGYFKTKKENLKVIRNVRQMLKPGGKFVLDFMNIHHVIKNLVTNEQVHAGGIDFFIRREISEERIIKKIDFETDGVKHEFREQVQLIGPDEIRYWLEDSGLKVIHSRGDHDLHEFDIDNSPRIILVAEKK